jgi:predicted RNA-binding protein with PUA domain
VQFFEALKAEFRDDNISRVEKGVAGADILHEVVYNGRICGLIVYDRAGSGKLDRALSGFSA